jgi:hypothetical protein
MMVGSVLWGSSSDTLAAGDVSQIKQLAQLAGEIGSPADIR